MSLAYCFDCLERWDECKCTNSSGQVFGEIRRSYIRGYRDAKEGKEEETDR